MFAPLNHFLTATEIKPGNGLPHELLQGGEHDLIEIRRVTAWV
ncbi:MAG: hypothetical protein WCO57_04120 [Verrucomicrobiota bacterium]